MVKEVDCPLKCTIPDDVELSEVPSPRHAWGDVLHCPNGVEEELEAPCGRTFLARQEKHKEST